jgi:anhydro-N-acetylmuramic acid kinase
MSGSSLDGLDIAYVQLEEVRGRWSFQILESDCVAYDREWTTKLQNAVNLSAPEFLKLHTAYGGHTGGMVKAFMQKHDLEHKVHFIASHGHTAFHDPANNTTFQLGDGAAIAATANLPVISDLRAMDIALGGQGAPIVPIGDKLLFSEYDYLLNIGGIANITIQSPDRSLAFDICPANQALNALAQRLGMSMDENGALARQGRVLPDVLAALGNSPYYHTPAPKSLSNIAAMEMAQPALSADYDVNDLLHTFSTHIASQIVNAINAYPTVKENAAMLITGGGAFNTFLVEEITRQTQHLGLTIAVPDAAVVSNKEALIMALIGALRWREEVNVLSSVTGAKRDSIGGAIWLP